MRSVRGIGLIFIFAIQGIGLSTLSWGESPRSQPATGEHVNLDVRFLKKQKRPVRDDKQVIVADTGNAVTVVLSTKSPSKGFVRLKEANGDARELKRYLRMHDDGGLLLDSDTLPPAEAVQFYTQIIDAGGASPWYYFARAEAHATTNQDYKKAVQDLSAIIVDQPNNSQAYDERAKLFMLLKDYDSALNDLIKLLELAKTNDEKLSIYERRSLAWKAKEDYQSELTDVQNAISMVPKEERARDGNTNPLWVRRAGIMRRLGRNSQAFAEYTRIITRTRNNLRDELAFEKSWRESRDAVEQRISDQKKKTGKARVDDEIELGELKAETFLRGNITGQLSKSIAENLFDYCSIAGADARDEKQLKEAIRFYSDAIDDCPYFNEHPTTSLDIRSRLAIMLVERSAVFEEAHQPDDAIRDLKRSIAIDEESNKLFPGKNEAIQRRIESCRHKLSTLANKNTR